MTHDQNRTLFEEAYAADGEVTFYFTSDAALFQELMGREEPGATGTTLSISCPTAYVGSEYATVQISPSLRTVVDGKESVGDYDWSDIVSLFYAASSLCDPFDLRIQDGNIQYDIPSWFYKKLVEANRNAEDSIVFEIVQAFSYNYANGEES